MRDFQGGRGLADARRFFIKLACWYPLLMLCWFPLGPGYRGILIHGGNALFSRISTKHEVRFWHHTEWAGVGVTKRADLAISVRTPEMLDGRGRKQYMLAKAVCTPYQPFSSMVFLIALFLATPLSGRLRFYRGLRALVTVHGIMLGLVLVDVAYTLVA